MASKFNELADVSDDVFVIVARELATGKADKALWTKAFALEDSDEKKTKAHYIRLRVAQFARRNPPLPPPVTRAVSAQNGSGDFAFCLLRVIRGCFCFFINSCFSSSGHYVATVTKCSHLIYVGAISTPLTLNGILWLDILPATHSHQPYAHQKIWRTAPSLIK